MSGPTTASVELRGFAELFDLDLILQENIYGVDLNEEANHIAKLSLWDQDGRPAGKELTSLDHNLVSRQQHRRG